MMIDFNIQVNVSEAEMIRFFREKGIHVKEIEGTMRVGKSPDETENVDYKQWVVINPNTKEEIPIEEKYEEIVSAHTRNIIINSIDRFTVFNSFM